MGAPTTRTKPAVNGFRPLSTHSRHSAPGPSHVVSKAPQKAQGPTALKAGVQSDRNGDTGSTPGEPDHIMNRTWRCRAFHKSTCRVGEIPVLSRVTLQCFPVAFVGHIWPPGGGAAVYTVTHILELVSGVGDGERARSE